eukprot:2705137-Prymnesium_polylepis.1
MASASSPPVRRAAAPRPPSSPHCHAASSIRSADSQSHSTSTLSPSRCLARVRSIATPAPRPGWTFPAAAPLRAPRCRP